MKTLLLLAFIFIAGCKNIIDKRDVHIVTCVDSWNDPPCICEYCVTDDIKGEWTTIIDTCNKYQIGDTIK